jgi:RIO kinase 1
MEGQFDDAPEAATTGSPRDNHRYIDEHFLEWSEEDGEEDEYEEDRVEDEDWEVAEGGAFISSQGELY